MFELSIVVFCILMMAPVVIKMTLVVYNLREVFTSGLWWATACQFAATGIIGLFFFDWVTSNFVSWLEITASPLKEKITPLGVVFLAVIALFMIAWEIESRAIARRVGHFSDER